MTFEHIIHNSRTMALALLMSVAPGAGVFYASAQTAASVSDDGKTVTLANDKASATFTTSGAFDITSMKFAREETVTPGNNRSPWTITYLGAQGETPEVTPACTSYEGYSTERTANGTAITFKWLTRLVYSDEHYPVEMRIELPDTAELFEWNIQASLPKGWTVTGLKFPTLVVNTPADGKIITPAGFGNEYDIIDRKVYEANYPSWSASMQMVMLHSPKGTFFYSPRDYKACGKLMTLESEDGQMTINDAIVASEAWNKDGMFILPWTTVTGYSSRIWADTARDFYRPFALSTSWGSKTLAERNVPQWIVEKDLWLRGREVNDSTLRAADRAIDYFGDNIAFHWYYWHEISFDEHYPDYFPAKEGFADIVKHIRSRNCQVMPYTNGRLWDPGTESYRRLHGYEASCRRPDGALYTEIYPTSHVPNTVTCPTVPLWQNVLLSLADSIQDGLGCNGIYLDQIAAAAPYACYASNHPHPHGGGEFWYAGYGQMLDEMRARHLKPGNIIFSEENVEGYIPYFDINLTVNTPHTPDIRIVPLYPTVYSDRSQLCGYTYPPETAHNLSTLRHINMQCLLYGPQLGWIDPRLFWGVEGGEREAEYLRNLLEFRRGSHDIFVGGRYMDEYIPGGDNPISKIPGYRDDYVVKGAKWLTVSGEPVLVLVNSDDTSHSVTLPDGSSRTLTPISAVRIPLSSL
ncbi:MAG: DUF6259 domain-containing protein [[Clostridium] fimetarium]|nr:DUF6259 domain-containing protein [[Clostridium] fimetarium]